MEVTPLTAEDRALVEQVSETNRRAFDQAFFDCAHVVAAGIQTSDGGVYEGVNVIVPDDGGECVVDASELLPARSR